MVSPTLKDPLCSNEYIYLGRPTSREQGSWALGPDTAPTPLGIQSNWAMLLEEDSNDVNHICVFLFFKPSTHTHTQKKENEITLKYIKRYQREYTEGQVSDATGSQRKDIQLKWRKKNTKRKLHWSWNHFFSKRCFWKWFCCWEGRPGDPPSGMSYNCIVVFRPASPNRVPCWLHWIISIVKSVF